MSVHNEGLFSDVDTSKLSDVHIAIIHTRWNDFIVDELVRGCKETLSEQHIPNKHITQITVPGSIELSFACKRYFESTKNQVHPPDAIIPFGCVIKGETPHFDYVCQSVTQGITQLNITLPIPVIYGILTVNDIHQAKERIGGNHGHKGKEAALTALQMIALNRGLDSSSTI